MEIWNFGIMNFTHSVNNFARKPVKFPAILSDLHFKRGKAHQFNFLYADFDCSYCRISSLALSPLDLFVILHIKLNNI